MISRLGRVGGAIAVALAVLVGIPASVTAQTPPRAALVVVHGDGGALTRCVDLPAPSISGAELLVLSGLDLSLDVSGGLGTTVCRVDNEGCSYPQEQCFCRCQGAPCLYWSYWQREGDAWRYSNLGASSATVSAGSMDAWVWNSGTVGQSADREPPALRFEDVCAPPTPEPTPEPAATETPTPQPTAAVAPVIDYFRADVDAIVQGQSVALRWDLHDAEEAWLQVGGQVEGVMAPGGKTVAPDVTTTYVLVARGPGGEAQAQVTVAVTPATPTGAPAAVDPPTATLVPASPAVAVASAPVPTATQLPTATPLPTAVPTFTPGWSTWETKPLTGSVAAVMPTPVQAAGAAPVIVNPTPRPTLPPSVGCAGGSVGRLALGVSAVVMPAALLLALMAARRRRPR